MAVLLVRHAHAVSRSEWSGDDDSWRPLSIKGFRQAQALVERLVEFKPGRVLSSPARRCIDTVGPLAAAAGLEVEVALALGEGAGAAALELVRSLSAADISVVLCSHGDVIPEVLAALAREDDLELGPAPRVEKASVWALAGSGSVSGSVSGARYLRPAKDI